jgi:hypothetical protein
MELTEWESRITHKRIGRPEVPAATRIWISKLPDLIDWLDELTADCPKKQAHNIQREIINAVLLAIVCDRVKAECAKLIESGADINQVNEALPDILAYYTQWQAETLQRCLMLDRLDTPQHQKDNVTPFKLS